MAGIRTKEMKHYTLIVHGKVQGVFFRASTREEAVKLGLTGYVKNNPDGNVIIEVEGEVEVIEQLVEWSHHGPPLAKVTDVEVTEGDLTGYTSFEIRR
ncbi:MAG: acylphosphatase [Cyclobacteriaceae bacterium]|nr:acylphosphatase [Cyclobacteriaceae bacterium]